VRILVASRAVVMVALAMLATACTSLDEESTRVVIAIASRGGLEGDTPAYYHGALYTLRFHVVFEISPSVLEGRDGTINTLYEADAPLPGGAKFLPVLDSIQSDGPEPIWRKILIEFKPGWTPRQFLSHFEIYHAAQVGEIMLTSSDEVYRCSVAGVN